MAKKKNKNGLIRLLSLALVVFMAFGLSACTEDLTDFIQKSEIQNPTDKKQLTKALETRNERPNSE